ncbi:MAG: glycosyltransferase [Rhodobacteraceae bacterium]|jgi:glycosyltransferase Alg8|nr:glycosyltransferase [Paracoccaceae bacterium]
MVEIPAGYPLAKALAADLARLSGPPRPYARRFGMRAALALGTVVLVLAAALVLVPNRFLAPEVAHLSIAIGALGVWRFGWWLNHALRAEVFAARAWPRTRAAADAVWAQGWRPRRLHIQMTTYLEDPVITRAVLAAVLAQVRRERIPTTLWIGTGNPRDERVIREFVEAQAADLATDRFETVMIRQNQPGKRMAIGLILRGIARSGVAPDDIVLFMDGDALLGPEVLARCLPLFESDPGLQALTTDEEVICYGPRWIASWLDMRFAQRRIAMQSHALSGRVLTLTGRMSMFRALHVIDPAFIRTIEADHLDHWLWGRFRFLSGDDKSSWFHLLRIGARMTYVPDATVYTIEIIREAGLARMVQNFRRWSGNMLRNGARAIALGPRAMPPFIWWCIVDQRIAMWTMMVAPVLAAFATAAESLYIVNVLAWIVATRLMLSLFLFRHARRADPLWPFILYLNQIINAGVKIYMVFHLAKQRWTNRGNQRTGEGAGLVARLQAGMALFQLVTVVAAFVTGLAVYAGVLAGPL